jgi:hypothetical protein
LERLIFTHLNRNNRRPVAAQAMGDPDTPEV